MTSLYSSRKKRKYPSRGRIVADRRLHFLLSIDLFLSDPSSRFQMFYFLSFTFKMIIDHQSFLTKRDYFYFVIEYSLRAT